jgi:hypothetical protein
VDTWQYPLLRAGIEATFDLNKYQRGPRPSGCDAQMIDGTLFSKHLPSDLGGMNGSAERVTLPRPPMEATVEKKERYEGGVQPPGHLALWTPLRAQGGRHHPAPLPVLSWASSVPKLPKDDAPS